MTRIVSALFLGLLVITLPLSGCLDNEDDDDEFYLGELIFETNAANLPTIKFIDYFTASTISNFILIVIVITWVSSYVLRVLNGKMTFMEQRKRYRKEYEKIVNDKLEIKFNLLSKEEQEKLMEDLEKNP